MQDECSLSFYQISEGQKIILKNPHYTEEVSKIFLTKFLQTVKEKKGNQNNQ